MLYLAPWVDLGGSDKGTIDWFRHIDRSRWAPSIITTQPSSNRWLPEIEPYAEEMWALPDLMAGHELPGFILELIATREVQVVHIMNSRLGFDLLPDMTCLPSKPVVVVQHHAEEEGRSGYVRHVASRYGNLVDGFSVSSEQLAGAMLDYDIAQSRIHVIATGVDAAVELNPDRTLPFDHLEDSGPRILWPGRFVDQKDPMLTLEIVKALDERQLDFTLHFVGEGKLRQEMIERIGALEIGHRIRWHPPSHEMPRWYRSCDLVLMTSAYEGVPYVIYESMAMGVPVVAPALPGNLELMKDGLGGALIDPLDDVERYADAIETLLRDETTRRQIGARARSQMLEGHSLSNMVAQHEALYEHLLSHRREREAAPDGSRQDKKAVAVDQPASLTLPRQPPPPRHVAVIIPCYQHGRFLPDAIRSLHEQTLRPTRIVVVDDASEDPETRQALDRLAHDPLVTVVRLACNSGPSAARNRALAEVNESYVLPLDADDMLPPHALETMVTQLERAPEQIGFIYPNVQHFGNRNDYFAAPPYNLNALLDDNYCAASVLLDRRIFEHGIRYAEEIVHGHEDWELVLQLAERGIHGEPAGGGPTLLYRKQGFSRVNAAEYGPLGFAEQIRERHAALYRDRRDEIKARWAPALSLLLVDGCDGSDGAWSDRLPEWLGRQTCRDFEVLRAGPRRGGMEVGSVVTHPDGALAAVAEAVRAARGRFVVLLGTSAGEALSGATFVEQAIRLLLGQELDRFVLARVARRRMPRLAPLGHEQAASTTPCGLAWRRDFGGDEEIVDLGVLKTPLEDVVLHWQASAPLSWRAV